MLDAGIDGPELTKISAIAKLACTDAAMWVTTEAVQILGGYGYIDEYPVERMLRDAKITQIYEGTNEIQRLVIAREMLRESRGYASERRGVVRHVVVELARRPLVVAVRRARRQLERRLDHVLVRDEREQVRDAVEARAALVVAPRPRTTAPRGCRCGRTSRPSPARSRPSARAPRGRSARASSCACGSSSRERKRRSCSSSQTENQYLTRMIPSSTSSRSKIGHWCRKRRYSSGVQKPMHVLDAGAVVPAAVEEDDLAGRRQVRDVALEVPLRRARARSAPAARRCARRAGSGTR